MSNSYRDVFKGTSIIGGSSFVKLLISMVQTKFVAIFLGTFGVGIVHSYANISSMISSFCSFGVAQSSIRYLSEAAGENGNKEKTEAITAVTIFLLSCVALITFFVFAIAAYPLALLTFKDASYTLPIIFLGAIAVVTIYSGFPGILLQSHRRLAAIATSSVICSILTALSSIVIYYYFRIQGILIALMLTAVIGLTVGVFYLRKFRFVVRKPTKREIKEYTWPIIKLGSGFFLPSFYNAGLNYINNLILLKFLDIDYTGLYYSAMNLSGALATFVLNAMGTDYYPRLVQTIYDQKRMQDAIDNQLDVAEHLALPGLVFMIVFSPLIIILFYSESFMPAILPLQILTIGVFGRVVSWPIAYVLLAKADMKYFFILELVSNLLLTVLLYCGVSYRGLNGAAASFGIGYFFYVLLVVFCVSKKHGYHFSRYNILKACGGAVILIGVVLCMQCITLNIIRWSIGVGILIATGFYCLHHLMKRMDLSIHDSISLIIRRKKC